MGVSQRNKGKRGESDAAQFLRDMFGLDARRSNQFMSGLHNPDVYMDSGPHWEVKFQEKCSVYPYINQAREDAGISNSGRVPAVMYRSSRKPWLVIIEAKDMIEFAKSILKLYEKGQNELSKTPTGNSPSLDDLQLSPRSFMLKRD